MGRGTVYNANMTENWNKVSKQNKKLVTDYIRYLKSNDKSPQTIMQYEAWLKVFFSWNYEENEDRFFIDLKKRDFVNYFGWLREEGYSANRIASLKSVLTSLSNEIELLYEDLYPNFRNQLRGLEAIHITPVREKTILSNEKIDEMLCSMMDKGDYQEACFLALLCSSGCRRSEAVQMKVSFFTEEHEVFDGKWKMYMTPPIRTKGRGKVGKQIKKYILKETFQPFFDKWMEQRKKMGVNCDALFVVKKENGWVPATIVTADSFAKSISRWFNINFYNHSCRHYFCTNLKNAELPDDIIVQIIGWSEKTGSNMVAIYDDTDKNKKIEKFFSDFLSEDDE